MPSGGELGIEIKIGKLVTVVKEHGTGLDVQGIAFTFK